MSCNECRTFQPIRIRCSEAAANRTATCRAFAGTTPKAKAAEPACAIRSGAARQWPRRRSRRPTWRPHKRNIGIVRDAGIRRRADADQTEPSGAGLAALQYRAMESRSGILVITGGSRGIGAATARAAAAAGYAVALSYLTSDSAAAAVIAEIESTGGTAVAVRADVGVEADVQRLFAAADQEFGRLTAFVNNAGTLEPQCRLEDMTSARIERVLRTNVLGPFLCAREAVRRMSIRHGGAGGAIVNVSLMAARFGSPREYIDYAASKGALDTMTIGLAREVADEGIRVNAVRPGLIYTDIHARGGEPGRVERLSSAVPMKRGGQPEEVAEAILWLLSSKAAFTTGSFIDVAGGL